MTIGQILGVIVIVLGIGGGLWYFGVLDVSDEGVRLSDEATPNLELSAYDKGEMAFKTHDYGKAIEHYKKAMEQNPDDPQKESALFHVAKSYEDLGEPKQAVTYYKKYLDEFPGGPRARDAERQLSIHGG
jgi:tetratricopeptide (TPR) repeat protein